MTPFRLRLLAVTFAGVAAAISINALYLQDASRLAVAAADGDAKVKTGAPAPKQTAVETKPVSIKVAALPAPAEEAPVAPRIAAAPKAEKKPPRQPSEIDAALETVASLGRSAPQQPAGSGNVEIAAVPDTPPSPRVIRAIQRELNHHGYDTGPDTGDVTPYMRTAIVSYEFDMGLPLTGRPSNRLLKSLLFEAGTALPQRSARAHFEKSSKLIQAVQIVLSRMGYGADSSAKGYLDEATRYAISQFEADRNLAESGRLTARLLLEIMIVTGQPITIPG